MRELAVEGWQHVGDQELEGGEVWEAAALQHEVIDAEAML